MVFGVSLHIRTVLRDWIVARVDVIYLILLLPSSLYRFFIVKGCQYPEKQNKLLSRKARLFNFVMWLAVAGKTVKLQVLIDATDYTSNAIYARQFSLRDWPINAFVFGTSRFGHLSQTERKTEHVGHRAG